MEERQVSNQPDEPNAVERLHGHGVILRGDIRIGEADYDLMITPSHLRGAATFEPGTEPTDTADITGRLMGPLYLAEPLASAVHTLVLDDGREFDFRVLQPETNEIIGVSWFRSSTSKATRH